MKIIKPTINLRYCSICAVLLFALCFIIFTALGISLFEFILLYSVIITFSMLGIKLFFHWIEYQLDEYKVSRINNFITYERVDIRYQDIKEINLKIGLLQRICNLGTISMLSNATVTKAGISFFNVENPLKIYQEIQSKIDQCKK
ncbi:MAG: PH domain-containing protein [Rickettsia endosymbiont of Argas persicus]